MGKRALGMGVSAALAAGACGGGLPNQVTSPPPQTAVALTAVSPAEGATGVALNTSIILRFSGGMASGMEQFMDLHMGGLPDGTVPMSCDWSADRETVTCTPLSPLMPHASYAIHVGGGMMDANGMMIDYTRGLGIGGQWVMGGMMSGTHAGMGWGMMGGDWRNPNGSYGLMFTFTTG